MDQLDEYNEVGQMSGPITRSYQPKRVGRENVVIGLQSTSWWCDRNIELIQTSVVPGPRITFESDKTDGSIARLKQELESLRQARKLLLRPVSRSAWHQLKQEHTHTRTVNRPTNEFIKVPIPRRNVYAWGIPEELVRNGTQLQVLEWTLNDLRRRRGKSKRIRNEYEALKEYLEWLRTPEHAELLTALARERAVYHTGTWQRRQLLVIRAGAHGHRLVRVFKRTNVRFVDFRKVNRAMWRRWGKLEKALRRNQELITRTADRLHAARTLRFRSNHRAVQVGRSAEIVMDLHRLPLVTSRPVVHPGNGQETYGIYIPGLYPIPLQPAVGSGLTQFHRFYYAGVTANGQADQVWARLMSLFDETRPPVPPIEGDSLREVSERLYIQLKSIDLAASAGLWTLDGYEMSAETANLPDRSPVSCAYGLVMPRFLVGGDSTVQVSGLAPVGVRPPATNIRDKYRDLRQDISGETPHPLHAKLDLSHLYGDRSRSQFLADFDDKRQMRLAALRNLDLGDDALAFNLTRSVGELKDLPQTYGSGLAFVAWLNSHAKKDDISFVRVRVRPQDRQKARLLLPLAETGPGTLVVPSPLWRDLTAKHGKKVLRDSGFRNAKRIAAGFRSGIPVLAQAYLAYKFAIEPTIQDVEKVASEGWEWAQANRRGLSKIVALVHRTLEKSLLVRRMWSVCGGHWIPKGNWDKKGLVLLKDYAPPRDMPGSVDFEVGARESSTGITACALHFTLQHSTYWLAETVAGRASEAVPYGSNIDTVPLPLWDGSERHIPVLKLRRTGAEGHLILLTEVSRDAVNLACLGHEDYKSRAYDILDELLVRENTRGLSNTIGLTQWLVPTYLLRGKLWCRYSARAILKSTSSWWDTLLAKNHALLTAWELTPLSFITEWFTNLRARVVVANAKAESLASGLLSPIAKSEWEGVQESLFLGQFDQAGLDHMHTSLAVDAWSTLVHHEVEKPAPDAAEAMPITTMGVWDIPAHLTLHIDTRRGPLRGDLRCAFVSGIRKYLRKPAAALKLPRLRVRINLQYGKLGTLAALLTGRK